MEKLNLPNIEGDPMPPPKMTMDHYVEFVEFYFRHLLNHKAYEELVRRTRVSEPFRLK